MSDLQESYSYDVPMCSFGDDDNNVDSWFDQVADAENVPPQSELTTENITQAENVVANKEPTPKTKARRSSKRLSAQQRNRQMAKIRAERKKVPPKQEQPPMKKPKLSSSRCKSADTTIKSVADASPKLRAKVTLPSTPTVLKRKHLTQKVKNTEEQELEKVQQLQQELAEALKKNEESLKSALAGDQPLKKVPIQATKPVDFHFHTDDRLKRHPNEQAKEYKQVDFTAELRKHPPSPASKLGRTVPKPFNLSKSNKRKLDETTAEYTSTAEQVLAFQKRTPQRFHLRSRQRELEGPSPVKPLRARVTLPKTPQLQTKQRHRPTTCKSSAEIEAEELEKLQQFKFKAQEINPKMLEGGSVLPRRPPVKEPTKAVGFNLEIEKRIQQREKKDEEKEEIFTFHSRPCPTKILHDVVGVPVKKMLPVTMPQSPAFALKNRIRMHSEELKEEPAPVIKANPMPYFGVPFKPKLVEQKQVEVCPFSFNERDRQRMEEKARKLEELRNAEPPKFKAQPLPDFDHISLPEKKVKEKTQPEPFNLELDKRGETRLQVWKHQIEEELKQQKEMSMFKARPNTVTHQEPFVPKKESRILTESLSGSIVQESFELATERRAKERQEFEKRLAELEAQKSLMEEEERRRQEEEEKEEINRLRQEAVHKAQPVRKFKALEVKTSDLPLTVPKSPNFSDRFKI